MIRGLQSPPLDLVVAWLPAEDRKWSLLADAPSLLPALLYADKVILVCPEADDLMEVEDFGELWAALGMDGADAAASPLELFSMDAIDGETGMPRYPEIWESLADRYAASARTALDSGQDALAVMQLARIAGLAYGAPAFNWVGVIRDRVPAASTKMISKARASWPSVMHREVEPDIIAATFARLAGEAGRYGLVDDPAHLLSSGSRQRLASQLDDWARSRRIEAKLGADLIRRLPVPSAEEPPWVLVVELRDQLAEPLSRFRVAMAEIAAASDSEPLDDDDFDGFAQSVIRMKVSPALDELDELTRESRLRSVFLNDVAGDPYSYVGPGMALVAAFGAAVPALIAAAIGAATPLTRGISHVRDRRRELRKHDYLFLLEAEHKLTHR
jgi:hypothetical protein